MSDTLNTRFAGTAILDPSGVVTAPINLRANPAPRVVAPRIASVSVEPHTAVIDTVASIPVRGHTVLRDRFEDHVDH